LAVSVVRINSYRSRSRSCIRSLELGRVPTAHPAAAACPLGRRSRLQLGLLRPCRVLEQSHARRRFGSREGPGCQMVIFKPKIKIWVNFGELQWKILAYFMFIWYILRLFAISYGHLVYFLVIW
jgi:hypothetical protein